MVGVFFPTPYPDECLYSLLCRYYVRYGGAGYNHTSKLLFGNTQTLTSLVYCPTRLECVDKWATPESRITRRAIAENHTMYPYFAITYSPKFHVEIENIINGGVSAVTHDRIVALKSRRSWLKCLRYCPLCAVDDFNLYGETYWHRKHQLQGSVYCTKHRILLVDSNVTTKRLRDGFYPATDWVQKAVEPQMLDSFADYEDKFLKIGWESEWLLDNGFNIDWSINGYEKYTKLLRDQGLASFQGRCDYTAIDSAFEDYWGKKFLELLFTESDDLPWGGWAYQIERSKMKAYKPLYHVLLMCFLADSVSGFANINPADTPYGHPPFICENPICPHYHVDGVKMVKMRYYGNGVTATFECTHCGLRYRHNKAKHSRELRVVEDYGHLWDGELRRCVSDPKITNEQTSQILKCTMSVLMLQKKKRELLEPPQYDTAMGPEKYYKSKVEELCKEHDEVTRVMLEEKVPGAYSYLGDHYPEWLHNHMVFERNLKHQRERDEQLFVKVQKAINKIKAESNPARQITFGYIAEVAGVTRDGLRRTRRNPGLTALLENAIESKQDWHRRRIIAANNKMPAANRPFSAIQLCRAASIGLETYHKYRDFFEEVVLELNKN